MLALVFLCWIVHQVLILRERYCFKIADTKSLSYKKKIWIDLIYPRIRQLCKDFLKRLLKNDSHKLTNMYKNHF